MMMRKRKEKTALYLYFSICCCSFLFSLKNSAASRHPCHFYLSISLHVYRLSFAFSSLLTIRYLLMRRVIVIIVLINCMLLVAVFCACLTFVKVVCQSAKLKIN
ncbi:hypothetical protein F5Y07DRAFT_263826 [Xylaria sp. FL0933]|nr:hypothetical protein F5Y07DRAFT_263826 [Xylaria sp. FL0933]